MLPVQSHPKKHSAFAVGQITSIISAIHPGKRGVSRSSRTRGWMRWTQRRRARSWSQGGFSRERSNVARTTGASGPSPVRLARCRSEWMWGCCVRRSRVVLASVADVKPAEMRRPDRAWTSLNPLVTVTRGIRRREEHEVSRKAIAQGMPDCLR